ncbi:hypothetical protein QHI69_00905 [Burkholderia gladioli pv. gladioli]|uniref:hypothetical protein n=1 Tax=Burkholderia gladioli TaxID=28095 RepID=UPI001641F228|nr:hypothetical protein [Burkholderia gladioli]MDJ1160462.1 hypothetical protein [Burkholderia gladioli pv. gladioli]
METDHNDVLDCEEGCYPYPDVCVKLVTGLERNPRAVIPRMATMVIVSTKDELAEFTFETYSPDYARHTLSLLPDVRQQVQQLRDLEAQRQDGWLLRKLRSPYMVTYRGPTGVLQRRFVLARSAARAYRKEVPEPYAGSVIGLSDLDKELARMEHAKTGKEKVPYAWSYARGGDFDRHAERVWAAMPPDEKARYAAIIEAIKEESPDGLRSPNEEDLHSCRTSEAPLGEKYPNPIPDHCVKLVIGIAGSLDVHSPRQYAQPMVVVTAKDDHGDMACDMAFKKRYPTARPQTVDDLADVRWQVQQLRDLDAQHGGGWLFRWMFKPCMVVHRGTMGAMHRQFMLAQGPVDARRKVVRRPYAGYALTLQQLEALLARMERVKAGEEAADHAWGHNRTSAPHA